MPPKLRVVVNRRPNADPKVAPFPVTEPVEWVYTEYLDNKAPPDSLIDADVYIGTDFTKEMGAAANSLKAILIAAAGYDRIDPDAVPEGCTVANAYHHEAPIAEWVMTVAVALDHELFKSDRTFRAGSWEMWPGRHGVYRELMGRTSASSDSAPSDAASQDSPKPTICPLSPQAGATELRATYTEQTTSEAANTPANTSY